MSIESFKHKKEKRAHIPSKEEAGYEQSNPKVKEKTTAAYPLNPVVHRGDDPELFWLNKYGNDIREETLRVDIRSLYRHEHVSPEMLIKNLYRFREADPDQLSLMSEFNGMVKVEEAEKPGSYYKHQDEWRNRMILGDSLLVMNSLLEREGMAGKVQMVYIDPPYGIRYNSNWQMKLNSRAVGEKDEDISGEPEVIKAYRDTWIDGIHTYLSYLRDRLLVVKELLTQSGSCFVQISDENVHLVRNIMDEVFGSENFCRVIAVQKTSGQASKILASTIDFVLWYAKDIDLVSSKYHQLYEDRRIGDTSLDRYDMLLLLDGTTRRMTIEEIRTGKIPAGSKRYQLAALYSDGETTSASDFIFDSQNYRPRPGTHWKTTVDGLKRLAKLNRIEKMGNVIRYRRFSEDFPVIPLTDRWESVMLGTEKQFVVQTAPVVIERCIQMTTDPGDLVLDPTCGSGTTAYLAEQWARRWITTDTSRIALNIAKQRVITAVYPHYQLYDEQNKDLRHGFVYKKVPHIKLEDLANNETSKEETLYDKPEIDNKKLRVAGPFTVETLQSLNPLSLNEIDQAADTGDNFIPKVYDHLKSAGVKTGVKQEMAVFTRIEPLTSSYLHAEGFYPSSKGERKAFIHIGPKFGTVSKLAVNEAIKECRQRGDADWLLILGFSFESDIANQNVPTNFGSFEVSKIRMHDDLMQEGLLKKDKKAASFVTIAEPEIELRKKGKSVQVEICGLDIYDPIKGEVKSRDIHDIAYWMLDDNYDGSNFIVAQAFFCGGDKDEFDDWKKGLTRLALSKTKKKVESTLKMEIDDEAFERLYGHISHPIEVKKKGQKIAVRVISQFGEESMKVLEV